MSHIKWISGAAGLLAFFVCCTSSQVAPQPEPVTVEVQQVIPADLRQLLAYSGTIEESETIPLSFSSVGTVARVFVSEGDAVKKGQMLAVLDTATYRNAYEIAHAAEQRAEDAYNRLTPMHNNGNLPDIKYVEVETGLQQARAAAAMARKNLSDCRLIAPTDGVVGKRSIDPGMVAIPNVVSITLVKLSRVYAKVSVPESEIAWVKKGERALVTLGALGSREFHGTVEEVGVMADLLAHSYKIKIGISNEEQQLKPGMICNVIIEHAGSRHDLVVPSRAVMVDESGRRFVYTVSPGSDRAVRRYLQTGELLKNGIKVLAGIQADERVVVSGQHKLVDQAAVRIVNP